MQNMIAFPQAGDGIAYALCTSLINSETLQALFISSANYTTAATPEPCVLSIFQNLFTKYYIKRYYLTSHHHARFAPVLPLQKK